MSDNEATTVNVPCRLPSDVVAKLEALVPQIRANLKLRGGAGRISRSTVIRLAMGRGIRQLERELNES